MAMLEAIEQRAGAKGVAVDARIERGRTYRHALERLLADEDFDRVVVPAGAAGSEGLSGDDLVWLLRTRPGRGPDPPPRPRGPPHPRRQQRHRRHRRRFASSRDVAANCKRKWASAVEGRPVEPGEGRPSVSHPLPPPPRGGPGRGARVDGSPFSRPPPPPSQPPLEADHAFRLDLCVR